jgi:hypothetical protein
VTALAKRLVLLGSLAAVAVVGGVCPDARADASPEPAPVKSVPPPDQSFTYAEPAYSPSLAWIATQLVLPSPEVGIGNVRRIGLDGSVRDETPVAFGLRWQLTPILWSWGVNRRVNRWRIFVVDPLARTSGSIELNTSIEYLWGHVDRFLFRPGVRATFPVLHRGEYLAVSFGTSTYQYDEATRVAYDFGAYFLYGILGAQVTVAPWHQSLQTIATFRIRYF